MSSKNWLLTHFSTASFKKYYLAHQIKMGIGSQCHVPAALRAGMRPGIHCVVGFVGPRTDLDVRGKSRPHRQSIPGTGWSGDRIVILTELFWPTRREDTFEFSKLESQT
jgi:hypothetical protein